MFHYLVENIYTETKIPYKMKPPTSVLLAIVHCHSEASVRVHIKLNISAKKRQLKCYPNNVVRHNFYIETQ
jgi:hypothetical protein